MTVLSIVQDVMGEVLGTTTPAALIGNGDPDAVRLLGSAKAAGQELYRAHDWSLLQREHTFTTAADVDNYAVPDDWGRQITGTAWDRDQFRQLRGSLTPAQWQRLRSGLVASPAARFQYRLLVGPLAGSILLDPVPGDAFDLVIEYVSRFWVEDSGGTGKASITADTDQIRLDHEVYRLGVLWRVKRSLGMSYLDERNDYVTELRRARVADFAMPGTNLQGRRSMYPVNLPDGSFGQ